MLVQSLAHSLVREDALEEEVATHSSILACKIPWTVQLMEFSRSDYWSGWPFPSPQDLPNPGVEPRSPTLQAVSLLSEPSLKHIWL